MLHFLYIVKKKEGLQEKLLRLQISVIFIEEIFLASDNLFVIYIVFDWLNFIVLVDFVFCLNTLYCQKYLLFCLFMHMNLK